MAIEWLIECTSDGAEPFRLGTVKHEQLIARRLGSIEQALFASPAYLSLHGHPGQPADLVEHECIFARHPQRQALWRLERDGESAEVAVRGRFMVNNVGLMRQLSERGMGIAALAPGLVRDAVAAKRLARVLPRVERAVPADARRDVFAPAGGLRAGSARFPGRSAGG